MVTNERGDAKRAPSRLLNAFVLCVLCIVLNVVGAQLALVFSLPVYLDSVGTILAAMVGGYVPGIVVGYATNLIVSISDNTAFYYGIVNVLLAVLAAYLAKRGWFKKLPLTMLAAVLFAIVGGLLGSAIGGFLNEADLGGDTSASFATQLAATGVLDPLAAQVCAVLFVNFVDKMLVVLFATLVFHLIPEEWLARLDFIPWRQAPLSPEELDAAMGAKPRSVSLSTKFVVLVASIMTFVAVATTAFSYLTFHQSMIDAESVKAQGITDLMAQVVDPERVPEYLAEGEQAPGYVQVEKELAAIRDSFDDVQYVYVYQIREDGCHVVFDPDSAEEPGSDPGEVVPFDESFKASVPTLLAGGQIDPIVSNESYGWLLTVYTPLKSMSGATACYLAVDISMEHLVADEMSFIAGIVTLFAAFFILVCAIVLWLARYSIIVPVNSISRASSNFMLNNDSVEQIKALEIRTGDEIENLYNAVNQMSQDAVRYVADAQEKNDTITRMQDNLIMVMADLVESRDKFTGDHVRNTASYTRIIMNQMRREGIHPETLTNEFISNVYKSAPLHDVGKIVVSDTILNKPGRFTDEEFEIMKRHTIAGKEILEGAKGAVSESSYLDEAQNLAAYHHEKWDGSGYPYGLSGEDIPLSARIMAVADVFDALVSKRSYKEGFPIEKALAIIEEGIGTHFDPQVARAFLHAQDKARAVAEKSNEKKRLEEEAAKAREAGVPGDAGAGSDTPDGSGAAEASKASKASESSESSESSEDAGNVGAAAPGVPGKQESRESGTS